MFYSVFNMITTTCSWILFLLTISQSSFKTDSAQIDHTACSPFRLLVIWHTSNGEDSAFIEQRRLVIQLIRIIPQRTEVQVTAINTRLNPILNFKKNTDMDWIYDISMHDPEYLENHSIQGSLINKLVFNFSEQNAKKEVADKILLVVSEKTEIEKRSLEMIKHVEQLVLFTGWNPPPSVWKFLGTHKHHLVKLNTTSESVESNINGAAETVLNILCQDSRLICDTDEFWAGESCISCSYICSEDTKTPPDICRELCPHYKRLSSKNATIETNKKFTCENIKPEPVWRYIFSVIFALFAILTILLLCRKLYQKANRQSRTHQKVPLSEGI